MCVRQGERVGARGEEEEVYNPPPHQTPVLLYPKSHTTVAFSLQDYTIMAIGQDSTTNPKRPCI
jgi:hypothetical protein